MTLHTLTSSEEEIMKIFWDNSSLYFREIMTLLPEPKPHQNTVSTFLKILVDKYYLTTKKEGRIYLYSPKISLDDYKKFVLKKFVDNYFDNSGRNLLKLLIDEKLLDSKDLQPYLEGKTIKTPSKNNKENDHIKAFIEELTSNKKDKKKSKKKKGKKKKKK